MKIRKYFNEDNSTGLGVDGLSKQKLKTLINKETKSCWYNKVYKDQFWQGPQCIWDTFDGLNLNWTLTKTQYRHDEKSIPDGKEWYFDIHWTDNKDKFKKLSGHLTAAGCGTVADPLSRYDLVLQIY